MFRELVEKAVDGGNVKWQRHALERMMERGISRNDVKKVLSEGELIEEYEDNHPLPSGLFLGLVNETALHVIAAIDAEANLCYIITAYNPSLEHFESDYRTRKK